MGRIIDRYVLAEILPPFAVSLLAFTVIVFSSRLLFITRLILVKGVGLLDILRSTLYLFPYLLVFTLPMAATVGILLAFLRLTADYEILALKTAGLSPGRLLRPVLAFSLLVMGLTFFLSTTASPWGQKATRLLLTEVVKKQADLGLQEQTFLTDFAKVMLFVHRVTPDRGELWGIFVNDSREEDNPQTIWARRGSLSYDPVQECLILSLQEGVLLRWGSDPARRQTVSFKTYALPLELFPLPAPQAPEREMSMGELREHLRQEPPSSQRAIRLRVEFHQRLALPLGALLLCLLAMPLGLSPRPHGRVWGLILGLAVFLGYYLVFTASWRLAFTRVLHPALAPYLADILCLLAVLYCWHRTRKDLPLLSARFF